MIQHLIFDQTQKDEYSIALLIKSSALNKSNLIRYYIDPLEVNGIKRSDIITFSLPYTVQNKAPVKLIKSSLESLLKMCEQLKIKNILVADAGYFKVLVNERKAEPFYGYVKPCKIANYEHINIILAPNYQSLIYNPDNQSRLNLSIKTISDFLAFKPNTLGVDIIHSASYPTTYNEIETQLNDLMKYPALTCDVETYGLRLAHIKSIAFAWDKHNGTAFLTDPKDSTHTSRGELLRCFFQEYKGELIFHNATFDIKQIIFNFWMNKVYSGYASCIAGLKTMFRRVHDTKILIYLATNNTSGNTLGLKHNAFEFTGNYAQDDIKDIDKIAVPDLLQYNLIDCLATWYVADKFAPMVAVDNQLNIYNEIMVPSLKVITNMELVGMPLDLDYVDIANSSLTDIIAKATKKLKANNIIQQMEWDIQCQTFRSDTLLRKKHVKDFKDYIVDFNPNSTKQLQELIYKRIGLEVIDKTDSGLPATGAKTLIKLSNQLISEYEITEEELL